MKADDITSDQYAKLAAQLFPGFNFITRLRKRLEKRGFFPDDPLAVQVEKAHEDLKRLSMECHYRSTGRKPPATPFAPNVFEKKDSPASSEND